MKTKDFVLLIPCFNNPEGLISSLSRINYPHDKFEVLIVDDGSDEPLEIENLKRLFPQYEIQLIRIQTNSGIVQALNTGLESLISRNDFKYIARLDCGDICHEDRFFKQVDFLDNNTEIALLGTWCRFVNFKTGKNYLYKTKTKNADIIREMHFKCSFIHPTVMFRFEVLKSIGKYPENFPYTEDYAYFWQILKKHKGAIIPVLLVDVKWSINNVSVKNYRKQLRGRMKVVWKYESNKGLVLISILLTTMKLIFPLKFIVQFKKNFLETNG